MEIKYCIWSQPTRPVGPSYLKMRLLLFIVKECNIKLLKRYCNVPQISMMKSHWVMHSSFLQLYLLLIRQMTTPMVVLNVSRILLLDRFNSLLLVMYALLPNWASRAIFVIFTSRITCQTSLHHIFKWEQQLFEPQNLAFYMTGLHTYEQRM